MIVLDVEQGSEEWQAARLGIPTASCFDRILTVKTMKLSAASEKYADELLAAWVMGRPLDDVSGAWMLRGTDLERKAVEQYEFLRDVETTPVGFITTDDGKIGCSPDRLVGEDGGLEIKCPSPPVHVGYMRGTGIDKYKAQVQGALYVTNRSWWDFLSFNPDMPPALVRFERDEEYLGKLHDALTEFVKRLDEAKARFRAEFGVEA